MPHPCPIDIVVGPCIPDGGGGCQRSTPGTSCCSPPAYTPGPPHNSSQDTECCSDCVPAAATIDDNACCADDACCDDLPVDGETCGDACCAPGNALRTVGDAVRTPVGAEAPCADSCCADTSTEAGDNSQKKCEDACCAVDDASRNAYDAARTTEGAEASCADSCCAQDGGEKDCCATANTSVGAGDNSEEKCEDSCCAEDTSSADVSANGCSTDFTDGRCTDSAKGCCTPSVKGCCTETSEHPTSAKYAAGSAKAIVHAQPVLRRRAIHAHKHNHARKTGQHSHTGGQHADKGGRHTHKSGEHNHSRHQKCEIERTFGRFFEAACCCLVDWRRHHHHHHSTHTHTPPTHASPSKPPPTPAAKPTPTSNPDPERGATNPRTLLLSVRGMDCPSCATKLTRALLTLPSVADVRVSSFAHRAALTYAEGAVRPEDIAARATVLTGFACAVVHEGPLGGRTRVLKVSVDAWDRDGDGKLPPGVAVRAEKRVGGRVVLDVEYDPALVQPRAVVAAFGGVFVPTPRTTATAHAARELRTLAWRTALSALLTIPVLVFAWAPLPPRPLVYGGASLALATLVQALVGAPLYSSALRSLFLQRTLDMDLLVVLSSTIAYLFSAAALGMQAAHRAFPAPFFETPTLLITLITLGRLVSAYARRRATAALDGLAALQPDTVELVAADGSVRTIAAALVHEGDRLRIAPGTRVPTDGVVARGHSAVDEAALTGESAPVAKAPGSALTAGTLNLHGALELTAARAPADNTVADIARLLLQVQDSRLRVQDVADKAAAWLAPVILAAAMLVFAVWMAVGVRVRGQESQEAGVTALGYAIAVLVVSCPCALVLCVPMVAVISAAVAAREGVLFKSIQAVQCAKTARTAVFDKTGTLTTGRLSVVEASFASDDCAALVLGLVSGSRHPVAQAIARYMHTLDPSMKEAPLGHITEVPGHGIEAQHAGVRIRGGNATWLDLNTHTAIQTMRTKCLTLFAVTRGGVFLAAFGLADTPRASAKPVVDLLARRGVAVHIVSGDEPRAVDALAAQLGVPAERAHGGCTPQAKLARVRALQKEVGGAKVMFFGDGSNDALALAQADVGVSLSCGTDIAVSAADVVVVDAGGDGDGVDLARSVRVVLAVSRGAGHRIVLNFVWSFVYNLGAVLLAAGAFVDVRVPPEYAALGEMVSVVPVVLVAWSMWLIKVQ
ncbi:hypothetical protein PLICRDRAFT_178451 [Plicaturopsis crispa FD-325 SS-3]|nr:hypothetical protein PLICRDRAFT_178451 [Plicaturopsis crispa FD-325 SS-3]